MSSRLKERERERKRPYTEAKCLPRREKSSFPRNGKSFSREKKKETTIKKKKKKKTKKRLLCAAGSDDGVHHPGDIINCFSHVVAHFQR